MSTTADTRPGSLRRGQAPDGPTGLPPAKICRIETDSAASDPPTGPELPAARGAAGTTRPPDHRSDAAKQELLASLDLGDRLRLVPDALPVGAIGAALLARQHLGDALPPAAVAGGGG